MSDPATALESLLAEHQIRTAMARYARGVDRSDADLIRSVFHPDALDHHGWGLDACGWDFAERFRRDAGELPGAWLGMTHLLGQHYVVVRGDRAASEVYFEASIHILDDAEDRWITMSVGRYVDYWERRGGDFLIAERTVVYDDKRTVRNHIRWPGPDHDVPKLHWGGVTVPVDETHMGRGDRTDPSYAIFARLDE